MTETALTRTIRTYDFDRILLTPAAPAVFTHEGGTSLTLEEDVWRRMGEPELITVAIEPGNTLNVVPAWSSCSNPACTAAHTRTHPLDGVTCSGCGASK